MAVELNVTNIYRLDISVSDIELGGVVKVGLPNFGIGPNKGQFVDSTGILSQSHDGITTVALNGGAARPIDYLGSGTATAAPTAPAQPVAVFALGSDVYRYAPAGFSPLADTSVMLNVDPRGTFDLWGGVSGSGNSPEMGGFSDAAAVAPFLPARSGADPARLDPEYWPHGAGVGSLADTGSGNTGVLCFASGTRILARNGIVQVEDLRVGDEVLLFDGGYAPIRWIGSRFYSSFDIKRDDRLRPIRIRAGALGHGLPERDLLVTRQHRCLLRSAIATQMFGVPEVLVPAKELRDFDGIATDTQGRAVEYWHLLLDRHAVLFSECAPTESLLLGPQAANMLVPEAVEEVSMLFPGLTAPGHALSRPEARGARARVFVRRMIAQGRLPLSGADDVIRIFDRGPVAPKAPVSAMRRYRPTGNEGYADDAR